MRSQNGKEEGKYLFQPLLHNRFPINIIRWCLIIPPQHQTNEPQNITKKRITSPYIMDNTEVLANMHRPWGITLVQEPIRTIRKFSSEHRIAYCITEPNNPQYNIPYNNWPKHFVGQTERKQCTRLNAHQLTTKCHEQNTLVSIQIDEQFYGNVTPFREFNEALCSSIMSTNQIIVSELWSLMVGSTFRGFTIKR